MVMLANLDPHWGDDLGNYVTADLGNYVTVDTSIDREVTGLAAVEYRVFEDRLCKQAAMEVENFRVGR